MGFVNSKVDTQGGDAVGRDNHKIIVHNEKCIFLQLVAPDKTIEKISQESLNGLDFTGISQECIQQAFRDVLYSDKDDKNLWNKDLCNLEGNDLEQILKKVVEFRITDKFLLQLSQNENVTEEIRNKLSKFAREITSKKHSKESKEKPLTDSSNKQEQLECYLLATIKPSNNNNDEYLLNAWLIDKSAAPVNDLSKFISLDNDEQWGRLYKFNELSKQLNNFLKESLEYLRGKQYQLIIEVFLPTDLISTEVDRWKIDDPVEKEGIALGIQYPIRLRSLERLDIKYLDSYLSNWYKYWNRVKTFLNKKPSQELFEHLEEMETFNWKSLKIRLEEKIGLKVTCAPPKAKIEELFKSILRATTPIVIWTRCDIPNSAQSEQVAEIDKILALNSLCDLSESVRKTRQEADAQKKEHIGFHLALLWEDPYRLPPDVMIKLKPPVNQ